MQSLEVAVVAEKGFTSNSRCIIKKSFSEGALRLLDEPCQAREPQKILGIIPNVEIESNALLKNFQGNSGSVSGCFQRIAILLARH